MKSFDDFKEYVSSNGEEIHSSIHQKVMESVDKNKFENDFEEHEFYRRAWVELGIMVMLEHYHNWINNQ